MMNKEEKIIEIISRNINKFASNLGYSYLDGGRGYWQDVEGNIHEIALMDDGYLNNALAFVERGIQEIENGKMADDIKQNFKSFVKARDVNDDLKYKHLDMTDYVMKEIEGELKIALNQKKEELEKYLCDI